MLTRFPDVNVNQSMVFMKSFFQIPASRHCCETGRLLFVVRRLLFVVCCLLFVVCWLSFVGWCFLVVGFWLFVVGCRLLFCRSPFCRSPFCRSPCCRSPFAVRRLPFVIVCCSLFVVCCLWARQPGVTERLVVRTVGFFYLQALNKWLTVNGYANSAAVIRPLTTVFERWCDVRHFLT